MGDTIVIETPVATVLEVTGLQGPQGVPGASQADVLTTQGDLLYRGASAAQRLGIGTAGQILKVNSGGTAPEWGAAPASGVTSVNGDTGAVTVTPASIDAAEANHDHQPADIYCDAAKVTATTQSAGEPNGVYLRNGSDNGKATYKSGTGYSIWWDSDEGEWVLGNVPQSHKYFIGSQDTTYPWQVSIAWTLGAQGSGTVPNVAQATLTDYQLNAAQDSISTRVPKNGNATSTEVVLGSDTRLTNSRVPTAHAASHGPSGSDPLFDQALNTTDSVAFGALDVQSQLTVYGAVDFSPASSVLLPPILGSLSIMEAGNNINGTFRAQADSLTANRTYDLPDASGTIALTSDILALGTGAGEAAEGNHAHGNITSDGKIGSTAGLPVVTTTAGAVTTLALGTANQVLRVNSGASGVEFADPAAAGVTGAASSASDVLGVSGSNITGVDAGSADRLVFWDDSANKLTYLEAGSGLSISGTTLTATSTFNPASPGAIGGTTPSTGAFTSLSTAPAANTAAFTTTGYSLTGSNAQSLVDLAGTWNTTGTPSAIKLNITDTASNASSLLMQLQTGGTNRFTVSKGGALVCGSTVTSSGFAVSTGDFISNGFPVLRSGTTEMLCFTTNSSVNVAANGLYSIGWASGAPTGTGIDVRMWRDAAATWALRDGTNAMEARVYGTFTSSTNYQRMTIKSVKQTLSALSGASATTTGTFIPDGAVVVGVTTRVATALTGATGYTIGDGTDADRWGDITGTAIGTTSDNRDWTAGTIECFTAGGEITLTAKTSNFTAGAIEICVFYLAGQAD